MKAKIKSVDLSLPIGVFEYTPERENCFSIWMTFTVGKIDSQGEDYFRLQVCSPNWLKENAPGMSWGRHMLLVDRYRPQEIIEFVDRYVSSFDERDWIGLAGKIARVMEWEFEDYS
ncbi:hypothetical protein J4H89_23315 (plasmid) [Ralstonia solanacearum]|nr:hypothetical protein J4H89_23315 [Ralstonia solanacearum]